MAVSSKADNKSQSLSGSAKLEPKLTILQKRNPQVFDWVQGLSRGKLTTFIYEVFDLYMQQGWLLEDDWIHPTDQKALSIIQKASGNNHSNEDFERLEQTLLEMKAQMSVLITLVQNQSLMGGNMPNMMGRMGSSPYFPSHNPQQAHYDTSHSMHNNNMPNDQYYNNGFNSNNINQNLDINSASKATQTPNENVLLDSNLDKNTSASQDNDTFIVVLDDEETKPHKTNSDTSTTEPIGDAGGFAVY